MLVSVTALAQQPARKRPPTVEELSHPSPQTRAKVDTLIREILDPEISIEIDSQRSKLIRTNEPVRQFSITDPDVLEVVQFSAQEFELIGGEPGQTTLTLWFGDQVLRYLVEVTRDESDQQLVEDQYGKLQDRINEMFPDSMVQLIPIADKLIVRGQARDSAEASEILSLIAGQAVDQTGRQIGANTLNNWAGGGGGGFVTLGRAALPIPGADDLPASQIISMLDVPGEQQVMLKVRIAELSRSALREMGADLRVLAGDFTLTTTLGVAGVFQAILESEDLRLAFQALSSNGYSKILAEPNLVTLNGQSAHFIAGGEFAVPTVVGVDGVGAATTSFRGFGTELEFTPTIIDKDRIRLHVSPSFSTLNEDVEVGGIPGLNIRAVSTTVDLREGQWLAIAGLLQDQQSGSKLRVPFLGDIPVIDTIFSKRNVKRDETELVILVSPEIVRPLDPCETSLFLPGMEVTEPNDCDFFTRGYYEGRPRQFYRSTIFPIVSRMTEVQDYGMFETKQRIGYQDSEAYYFYGPRGFSR
ncbi:MAG TPA: pilus assembly protein N-terminal domain-containing protein [Thermoguttaceae bacterium]|nr:pilus assembly protein N-terminal domain-containing protein [Thermoguttaceae bacterium]